MYKFRISKQSTTDKRKLDGRCKRHPKHRQSPGVCALCLRERLIRLSAANGSPRESTTTGSSFSSLSSYYSSCSESSCSSPAHGGYRFTLEGKGSLSSLLSKSKSVAFIRRKCEDVSHDKEKKKNGLWTKLLSVSGSKTSRNQGSLLYSKTVRERTIRC